MSQFSLRKKLSNSNLFLHKKAPMRKSVSRSAVTLSAAEIDQEFGTEVRRVEAKIGDTTLRFDPERSVWLFGSSKFENEHFSSIEIRRLFSLLV